MFRTDKAMAARGTTAKATGTCLLAMLMCGAVAVGEAKVDPEAAEHHFNLV